MKKLLLTLMCLLGTLTMFADEVTLQLSSSAKFGTASGSTLKQNGVTWTVTTISGAINGSYQTSYNGEQFGKNGAPWHGTFSTSDISGTITKVEVGCNTGGSATVAVKVGGNVFGGAPQAVTKKSSGIDNHTFTGSASGTVSIELTGTSAACYLGTIKVTYSSGTSTEEPDEPENPEELVEPDTPGHYNFVDWEFPGASEWTSSYAQHIVKYKEATITFANADKNSSPIQDCPVTKGSDITVELTGVDTEIVSVSATFKQWNTKAQTISLYVGASLDDIDTDNDDALTTSSDFKIENEATPVGTRALKFKFNSGNQIGIASINIVIGHKVTIADHGFATLYYSDRNLTVPAGVSAWTFDLDGNSLVANETYTPGRVIPADEAVVLYSANGGTFTFEVAETAGAKDANNKLKGTDEAKTVTPENGGILYFLGHTTQHGVAFYKGGSSIDNGAHKAYLEIPASAKAPALFSIGVDNGTTAINCITIDEDNTGDGAMYDVLGRKVDSNYKGFVIKNGKKFMNK